jgi:chemotaxis signal transduction protein
MEIKLEVATIQANCEILNGYQLYWLVSRNQLEFILQHLEVFRSPSFTATAQYQEVMLPVINLEKHFGLTEKSPGKSSKYLVLRAADANQALIRLIVETPSSPKIQKLEKDSVSSAALALPKNNVDILGIYSLSESALAIVPDIAGISRSLKLRGDHAL